MTDWKTFVLIGVGASAVSALNYFLTESSSKTYKIGNTEINFEYPWQFIGINGAIGAFLGSSFDIYLKK